MKLPPQNLEAEESLLASILVYDNIFEDCDLDPEDFYKTDHQKIFKIMKNLKSKGERIDLVTIGSCLMAEDNRDLIYYISKLPDTAPLTTNIKSTVKIIKSLSVKRKLAISIMNIQDKIDSSSLENLIDFAQSEIMKFTVTDSENKIFHISDLLTNHIDTIEKHNTIKKTNAIKTGFQSLDKRLDIDGPTYSIIAGRPGMGKTAFALSIIKNMALNNQKPGILSLEMGKNKLLDRWLAMMTGINSMNFHKYQALNAKDWQKIQDAVTTISDLWNVYISDAPARSIGILERQARQMVSKGVNALFIDQLNQIGAKGDDDFKNFTRHSQRIAQLKKELGIPIFLLSQLNRKVEDRSNKEPTLADLKMSGSLEEDPDIIIFLYRPVYYETDQHKKALIERDVYVNIAKNRDGETYNEKNLIIYDKSRTLFEEDFSRLAEY